MDDKVIITKLTNNKGFYGLCPYLEICSPIYRPTAWLNLHGHHGDDVIHLWPLSQLIQAADVMCSFVC